MTDQIGCTKDDQGGICDCPDARECGNAYPRDPISPGKRGAVLVDDEERETDQNGVEFGSNSRRNAVHDPEQPFIIGQDFVLGDRIDLTNCDCSMCSGFRQRLAENDQVTE